MRGVRSQILRRGYGVDESSCVGGLVAVVGGGGVRGEGKNIRHK